MTLPRFRRVGVAQVHPQLCLNSRGDSASSVRLATMYYSLFSLSLRGVSSTYADDHVDRLFVVRPMTWRFMITLRVTLSQVATYASGSAYAGASFIFDG